MITFRETIARVAPHWLQGKIGGGILRGIGAVLDAMFGESVEARKRSMPGADGAADNLVLLARDRNILRAPGEPASAFHARLLGWLDAARTRGNPYSLLGQVNAWYGQDGGSPADIVVSLVYANGTRFRLDTTTGAITRDTVPWEVENPAEWARWWLFYEVSEFAQLANSAPHQLTLHQNPAHAIPTTVVIENAPGPTPIATWGYPVVTCDEEADMFWSDVEVTIYE